jgi:hypothetical protein
MMLIKRQSIISGEWRERELDVTEEQLKAHYENGVLAQKAFPHLSDNDREFIMTGIVQEEWDELSKKLEEPSDYPEDPDYEEDAF